MKIKAIIIFSLILLLKPGLIKAEEEYIIGTEDVIFISVWDNKDLNMAVPVRPDGKISFPLLDDLQAAGKTAMELQKVISGKLKKFINNPDVTVIVNQINSYKIFVYGEVNRPGLISLSRYSTILQSLSIAGGISQNADLARAKLIRKNKEVAVDFYRLIKEGDLSQDITLKPGDLIYIPDNFRNRVRIIGEVKNPMIIPFQEGLTVLDAALMAGGLTEYEKANKTRIYRKQNNNSSEKKQKKDNFQIIPVELKEIIEKGDIAKNILLQPEDVIIVPRSIF